MLLHQGKQRLIIVLGGGIFSPGQDCGFNAVLTGPLQRIGLAVGGNHQHNSAVGVLPCFLGIDQRLQVGTRTADKHANLKRLGRIGAGRTGVGYKA